MKAKHPPVQLRRQLNNAKLSDVICWSRMQAEAGQQLAAIVARKELERRAGDGIFFWGVGNAPARVTASLAASRRHVDVVFSTLLGKPKPADIRPARLYVWRRFINADGSIHSLPPGSLVTSRGDVQGGEKRRHYALMCHSAAPLVLGDFGAFDPTIYRNLGGTGAPIGASQVTAILQRHGTAPSSTKYRVNMRAELTGAYWVKLCDPIEIRGSARVIFEHQLSCTESLNLATWRDIVRDVRGSDYPETTPASMPWF